MGNHGEADRRVFSREGLLADLDVAIRASGDDPDRIPGWPELRYLLRSRFGEDRTDRQLWERFTDWLRAERGLPPNEYLPLGLGPAADLLRDAESASTGHGPDFRCLKWFGAEYSFTANQAPVVRLLYEAYRNGTPEVGDETLLLAVDSEAPPGRLANLFRGCHAWGTIIVPGRTRGTHRLISPAEKKFV